MIPPETMPDGKRLTDGERLRWFRNTKANEAFDTGSSTLDFSLQLGVGIQNQKDFRDFISNLGGVSAVKTGLKPLGIPATDKKPEYRFTRDPD